MKKLRWMGIAACALLLSGCGTSRTAQGDPNAVLTGAAIGGNVGNAIGGLIGEGSGGWRGGYRGSAIGTIVGTIAGAAIANAATAPKKESMEDRSQKIEVRSQKIEDRSQKIEVRNRGVEGDVRLRNIRFIDESRDRIISSNENSKLIFEIMNEGNETAYNVIPVVTETSGMKRIYISPSILIEQIAPHEGVKYTANISAGNRIKTGEAAIRISLTDEYGNEYDRQEFTLQTRK